MTHRAYLLALLSEGRPWSRIPIPAPTAEHAGLRVLARPRGRARDESGPARGPRVRAARARSRAGLRQLGHHAAAAGRRARRAGLPRRARGRRVAPSPAGGARDRAAAAHGRHAPCARRRSAAAARRPRRAGSRRDRLRRCRSRAPRSRPACCWPVSRPQARPRCALPGPARDHTERMLASLGVDLAVEEQASGGRTFACAGPARLPAARAGACPATSRRPRFCSRPRRLVPVRAITARAVGLNPRARRCSDVLERDGRHASSGDALADDGERGDRGT